MGNVNNKYDCTSEMYTIANDLNITTANLHRSQGQTEGAVQLMLQLSCDKINKDLQTTKTYSNCAGNDYQLGMIYKQVECNVLSESMCDMVPACSYDFTTSACVLNPCNLQETQGDCEAASCSWNMCESAKCDWSSDTTCTGTASYPSACLPIIPTGYLTPSNDVCEEDSCCQPQSCDFTWNDFVGDTDQFFSGIAEEMIVSVNTAVKSIGSLLQSGEK